MPIGLSYLLLYLGFGYGAVETFIIGAALSATSLGTTFAVIAGASKTVDLSQTRVGAVLVSAAVIDDVTGLVMSSVIHDLGTLQNGGGPGLGWLIGRPIVASAAMAILTPVLSKFVFGPIFGKFIERRFAKFDHLSNIVLMVLVLCAFVSIAAYAGTSVLFGAFLAGAFVSYLPSKHPDGPFVVLSKEEGEREKHKSPTFVHRRCMHSSRGALEAFPKPTCFQRLVRLRESRHAGIWSSSTEVICRARRRCQAIAGAGNPARTCHGCP